MVDTYRSVLTSLTGPDVLAFWFVCQIVITGLIPGRIMNFPAIYYLFLLNLKLHKTTIKFRLISEIVS